MERQTGHQLPRAWIALLQRARTRMASALRIIRRLDEIPLLEGVDLPAIFSPQLVGAVPADQDDIAPLQGAAPLLSENLAAVRAVVIGEILGEIPGRARHLYPYEGRPLLEMPA